MSPEPKPTLARSHHTGTHSGAYGISQRLRVTLDDAHNNVLDYERLLVSATPRDDGTVCVKAQSHGPHGPTVFRMSVASPVMTQQDEMTSIRGFVVSHRGFVTVPDDLASFLPSDHPDRIS